MKRLRWARFVFCFCLAGSFALQAQQASEQDTSLLLQKNLYESLLMQAEKSLAAIKTVDSLLLDLLHDARDFASRNKWQDGREILNTLLILMEDSNAEMPSYEETWAVDDARTPKSDAEILTHSFQLPEKFQIETGLDYSSQEIETSFDDNFIALDKRDSTLVEELQNPYFSFTYNQLSASPDRPVRLSHRLRLDDQYFSYNLFASLETFTNSYNSRLEFDGDYFFAQAAEETNFFDGTLRYQFRKSDGKLTNVWYISAFGRMKWHPQIDSLSDDFYTTGISAYYERYFNFNNSAYFTWTPSFYREVRQSQDYYFQNSLAAFYRYRKNYNRFLQVGGDMVYQTFRNDLQEEQYRNRYLNFSPRAEGEWEIGASIGMAGQLELAKQLYEKSDAITPDFLYYKLETVPKVYIADNKSLGVGYFWEKETHQVQNPDDRPFARESDFYSRGVILRGEYLNLDGMMINAEYRLSWRFYPNARETDSFLDSYYSDRLVHSVYLFGWIPISPQWQVQMFINYDNDRDREKDFNDSRNTILSFGLIYKL